MDNQYLPWIEKYRPKKLAQITSHENIVKSLKNMIKNGSLPHLLFHGKSGTGKTSTIITLARKLYGNKFKLMVLTLDASDDRGINAVREEIKGFAEKSHMFHKGIKLIILDEADAMTWDAQFALRRTIEKYSDNTRFCLICNYENKIIKPIRSRCANFHFSPIPESNNFKILSKIVKNENVKISKEGIKTISKIGRGDLRKSINLLQSISMKLGQVSKIDRNICYQVAGIPTPKEIDLLADKLVDEDVSYDLAYKYVKDLIKINGYSLSILLAELVDKIYSIKERLEIEYLSYIFDKLSDLENRVAQSTFGDIYYSGLVGIFKANNKN